ncbi:MAG TPA: adenylate/guanylate cyclase domain-containing protein [Acidimicrobiales bacterium]|nr:adenylate/guanylate cyclase domain-containing protein [Acidimicrobiales bacterium]
MPTSEAELDVRVGTIMFTDLVGFTEYNDSVGDAAALAVLDRQVSILGALLDGHADGRLVKEIGDGLMVWFAEAANGVVCAIAFLAAINEARRVSAFPLAMRVGVHHGEAIARGDDLVGRTVNIASRVADLAGPGELLVSEDALRACADRQPEVRLQPVGPASVRGVEEPIWLHRFAS